MPAQTPRQHAAATIQRALNGLIPGAADGTTMVEVRHERVVLGRTSADTWSSDAHGFAQRLALALDVAVLQPLESAKSQHERTHLAWKSAARRASRRQPHEREGLIFHLERENTRLHAFIRLANEAAQVSSGAFEKAGTEAFRLREEIGRLRSQREELRARMEADIRKARFTDADVDIEAASSEELRAHIRELRSQLEETTGHRTYWHHEVQCADARLRELEDQVRQATAGGDR
ncbi:hypothetical protein [Streptomyces sp. bgisy034]|uniref:hypothetical protein n=1 Tax=Streptomyces sp. bgisy034 TaxID=3413774 RepID=UPI003EB93498